ncbi:MAG: SDR family oxidoreductase [Rhodothermales bacterium]
MSFEGKVVWVTGASSGIGEALAYALAERGAHLILSARREEKLRAVQAACAHADRHVVLPLDLASADSLNEAAQQALDRCGHIDLLIHNGGVSQRSLAIDTQLDVDRRIMEVNYFGTVALTKAVMPSMIARGVGHIAVVTSLVGKFGSPMRTGYAASKHALHGFFDSLRAEVHAYGLCVTMICPGFIRTNVSINALTGDGTPQGKMDRAQQKGLDPASCARQILRALEREKDEVYIAGKEKAYVYLRRFLPGLFNRLLPKVPVT